MKLSNKILIGFFGVVFLYLSAAFAELRLTGTPGIIDETNSVAETVPLPGLRYVIVNGFKKEVNIIGSNRPGLEVRSISGDLLKKVEYEFSGDTLILSQLHMEDLRSIKVSVLLPKEGVEGISVTNGVAGVENIVQAHLNLSQSGGRVWMSKSTIGHMAVAASAKSYLNISETQLDTLSADIEKSEVYVSSPVNHLRGEIRDTSQFRMSDVDEIHLRKDENSSIIAE